MEEEPEQKLGSDDAPESSQSQTTPSPGVRRLPDDSSSGGNTAEVAAAVAAIRIRDGSEGDAGGAGREDRPDGVQRDRRFTFAEGTADGEGDAGGAGREDRPDGVQRDRRVTFAEGTVDGGQDQNAPDAGDVQVEEEEIQEEEGDREGGREEIARILWERFLDGEEEGVNYTDVDGDERLDDLDQIDRDEVIIIAL